MFTETKLKEIADTFKGSDLALHRAVLLNQGGRDFFSGIVRSGFKLDEYAPDGTTAMHWAARLGQLETLRTFIEGGKIDLYMKDKNGKTFFDYAKEYWDNNKHNPHSQSDRTLKYLEGKVLEQEKVMEQKVKTLRQEYDSSFVALKKTYETVAALISKPTLEPKDYLAIEAQANIFMEHRERFVKFQREFVETYFKLYEKNQDKISEMHGKLSEKSKELFKWDEFMEKATQLKPSAALKSEAVTFVFGANADNKTEKQALPTSKKPFKFLPPEFKK